MENSDQKLDEIESKNNDYVIENLKDIFQYVSKENIEQFCQDLTKIFAIFCELKDRYIKYDNIDAKIYLKKDNCKLDMEIEGEDGKKISISLD